MTGLDVRIINLKPMFVASSIGFGTQPELEAWEKLLTWAEKNGLLDDKKCHRFFGFNNPDPSPGSPNYGYEQWMTISPEIITEKPIMMKEFEGGLYAVIHCPSLDKIGDTWKKLITWADESSYQVGSHQCLEELLTQPRQMPEEMKFDLYLPIIE